MLTDTDSYLSLVFSGVIVLSWLVLGLVLALRPSQGRGGALGLLGAVLALLGSGVQFAAAFQLVALGGVSIFERITQDHLSTFLGAVSAAGIALVVVGFLLARAESATPPPYQV